tara:strand:- start:4830 stop:5369 length:540 start_codon:yes stop_codon:yes gene_type:complete
MKNELQKSNNKKSELINPDFEEKLSIESLTTLIENYPDTSYSRIYNDKMFKTGNFLMKINKKWLIWLDEEASFDEWNWNKDMSAINKHSDFEEIHEFNSSWSILSTENLDFGGEKLIEEEINKRNPENVTYITREYLESLEEEKLDIEEYIKSAIKKYDGSENSLDNVSKKIMRKVLKK